ncbi:MAG: response regulator [Anaerolineae bacterium]|nr:response regulator [Anaerolineae bacterium]
MREKTGRTILVVDDQTEMRTMLNLTLSRNDWQVIEAVNGQEAVELAQKHHPGVILMDYNMPIMNGIDACKAIKSNTDTQEIPVLIYTGLSALDLHEAAISAGAVQFLTKPIPPNDLRQAVEAAYQKN